MNPTNEQLEMRITDRLFAKKKKVNRQSEGISSWELVAGMMGYEIGRQQQKAEDEKEMTRLRERSSMLYDEVRRLESEKAGLIVAVSDNIFDKIQRAFGKSYNFSGDEYWRPEQREFQDLKRKVLELIREEEK